MESFLRKHTFPTDADDGADLAAAVSALLAAIADGDTVLTLQGAGPAARRAVLRGVAASLEDAGVRVLHIEAAADSGAKLAVRDLLAQVAGREPDLQREGALDELLDLVNGTDPAGVVLAVDDADQLQPDALEFFRLLAVLGRGQRHRSRMVLSGPSGFADRFEGGPTGKRAKLIDRRVDMDANSDAASPEPVGAVADEAVATHPAMRPRRWPSVAAAAAVAMGAGGAGVAWHMRTEWPRIATLAASFVTLSAGTSLPPPLTVPVALAAAVVENGPEAAVEKVLEALVEHGHTARHADVWPEPLPDFAVEPGPALARPPAGQAAFKVDAAAAAMVVDSLATPLMHEAMVPEDQPAAQASVELSAEAPVMAVITAMDVRPETPASSDEEVARAEPPLVLERAVEVAQESEAPVVGGPARRGAVESEVLALDAVPEPPHEPEKPVVEMPVGRPQVLVEAPTPVAEPVPIAAPVAALPVAVPLAVPMEASVGASLPTAAVAPVAAPVAVAGRPAMDAELMAALMRRGEALVALGDISAARLVYGRAAAGGSGAAAAALGRTWDPRFLAGIGGRGISGDEATAARWYRQGMTLGEAAAGEWLRQLGQAP